MPDLMEFDLGEVISIQEPRKILSVGAGFRWLAFSSQEIMAGVTRIELLDDVAQERRIRDGPNRALRFWGTDMDI